MTEYIQGLHWCEYFIK